MHMDVDENIFSTILKEDILYASNRAKDIFTDLFSFKKEKIDRLYVLHLLALFIFRRKKSFRDKLKIVKNVNLKDRETIIGDKNLFALKYAELVSFLLVRKITQTTVVLKKEYRRIKPFWVDEPCLDISKHIWLPNQSNSVRQKTPTNSCFSMETVLNKETLENGFMPEFWYMQLSDDDSTEEKIQARKIRIYPTQKQAKILREWNDTSRYVYNQANAYIKEEGKNRTDEEKYKQYGLINFFYLRNTFVTNDNLPEDKRWQTNTPKDIRAGAVNDLVKAYKTSYALLKKGLVRKFTIGYRCKKNNLLSLVIAKSTMKVVHRGIQIYSRFNFGTIRTSKDKSLYLLQQNGIESDCRIQCLRGIWYFIIPYKKQIDEQKPSGEICALDPGVRKFQTVYAENKVVKIYRNETLLRKLLAKLDTMRSLRTRKKNKEIIPDMNGAKKHIRNSRFKRCENRVQNKISHLVDEMHFKTISMLTKSYKCIILPSFESQEMSVRNKCSSVNRNLYLLKHYTFKMRLKSACELRKQCNLVIGTEEYTSKTCTKCGYIRYRLGSSEVYNCDKCNITIDRDVNGSRNIYIKNICGL